ncbi:MAG: VCBS repeat-containing protein [Nitrospinae bacterium]|nr:VCBS repeat-containing protein [Nitrospinota bacterium]
MEMRIALFCAFLLCVGCDSAGSKRPADAGPADGGLTNASPAQDGPAPWFSEEAQLRGLNFDHHSGSLGRHRLPEIVGGGAALADFDGDGDLDAYLVQSGDLGTTDAGTGAKNRLYINRGDGYFDEAPQAHGAADGGYGMGVAAGDYDGDGDVDLYVTNVGPNVLLRNEGEGEFRDVTFSIGLDDPRGDRTFRSLPQW